MCTLTKNFFVVISNLIYKDCEGFTLDRLLTPPSLKKFSLIRGGDLFTRVDYWAFVR